MTALGEFWAAGIWQQLALIALCLLAAILAGMVGLRESKERCENPRHPGSYEPILWAETGSWWKTPLYRFEKLVFVDCFSPAGAFLGIMVWMNLELLPVSFKDAWLVPAVLLALLATACFNFALPKYRGAFIGAMIELVRALAARIGGWKYEMPREPHRTQPPNQPPSAVPKVTA